jgi:hypothetical protein
MHRAICLITFIFLTTAAAHADECFRIPRPAAPPDKVLMQSKLNQRLLGDLIYAGMRTPMPRSLFERWRQNYCSPFVCNMVLCHNTCAEFAEHCPSFSESGRVIHLDSPTCLPSDQPSITPLAGRSFDSAANSPADFAPNSRQ